VWAEYAATRGSPLGVDACERVAPGGNMEGKEVRFGVANSRSVGDRHDRRLQRLGQRDARLLHAARRARAALHDPARRGDLRRRRLGLYGMLVFAIIAVFVAGLMVGRTPEYLGKKIESYEMKMSSLVILFPCLVVLVCTAIAVVAPAGLAGRLNPGPHGFSEILYAFSSMGNNNGSAFAGLSANAPFYNLLGGVAMLVARYWLAIPTLAIAGSLARKKIVPPSPGTLPTHTPLFVAMLIGVVIIVGVLTFIPALALGPIVEHLMLIA
jgi:K+-transporting ATPase ATPase A chain